jgi:hypothetical protein
MLKTFEIVVFIILSFKCSGSFSFENISPQNVNSCQTKENRLNLLETHNLKLYQFTTKYVCHRPFSNFNLFYLF